MHRHAHPAKAHTTEEYAPLSLCLSHTHSASLSHTRTRARSHTRAVLSGAPLLDHSHLAKEVPAEGRESRSERETKGRRTVEGEERIGARGPAQGRGDPALCEEQKARDRRREEEKEKKRRGNRKRDHFQLQRSVSQHGQCTIPRHVILISLQSCVAGIFLILRLVLSNQLAVLLSHSVKAGDGGWAEGAWSAASLEESDAVR